MKTNNPITPDELVNDFPLLRELTKEEATSLASSAEYRLVGADVTVVSHGAVGETLYLIRSGSVNLQISGNIAEARTNGQAIGEESLFGEAAMRIPHYKAKVSSSLMRTADAVTASACEFVLLSHEVLIHILDKNEKLFRALQHAGTKTTLQHGYLGSEEAKAIIRAHTVAPPGQELIYDFERTKLEQPESAEPKREPSLISPIQDGLDSFLAFFQCAPTKSVSLVPEKPVAKKKHKPHDESILDFPAIQNLRGNYSGVQVLSTAEVERYEKDTQQWLTMLEVDRPPSMEQPLAPDLLHKAAFLGDMAGVESILAGPDGAIRTITPDRYGRTALHLAAVKGHTEICQVLLNAWPDRDGKHRLAKMATKDAMTAADVATTQGYEKIVQNLMVFQFGVMPSVVAALESRYQIRKKKGSIFVVYEMLAIEDRINKRFGLTPSQILAKLEKYGLSWHSMADTHKLLEHLVTEQEARVAAPVASIRDGRVIFQDETAKRLRATGDPHGLGEYV